MWRSHHPSSDVPTAPAEQQHSTPRVFEIHLAAGKEHLILGIWVSNAPWTVHSLKNIVTHATVDLIQPRNDHSRATISDLEKGSWVYSSRGFKIFALSETVGCQLAAKDIWAAQDFWLLLQQSSSYFSVWLLPRQIDEKRLITRQQREVPDLWW